MGRKKKQLTQAHIDWRNAILRGKVTRIKKADEPIEVPVSSVDEINRCFYYLNNCVFWINEYIDGRVNNTRLLTTAQAIKETAIKLETILKTDQPK